jgi:hypothetical protein
MNVAPSITTAPINVLPTSTEAAIGASASGGTGFESPHVTALAHRLAELFIVWQKTWPLAASFKSPSRPAART